MLPLCNCGNFPPAHAVHAAWGSKLGCRAAVAITSQAGEPQCPDRAQQHPWASQGQSAQACPRDPWLECSATRWAAGTGDVAGLERPKGAPQTLTSLGAAGERADPCSCPSPLPLCNRLPELLTFRSPRHKARRVVVWRESERWPHSPSSLRRTAPSAQSVRGLQKQLRRFSLPPARTPGSLWGWEREGGRQATSGNFVH